MKRTFTSVALCLTIGACATYDKPGTTASTFDGPYQGTVTAIHVSSNSCASAGPADSTLKVQNGSVVWTSAGNTVYAPISSDGAFSAQNGPTFFSGKITDRAMVARVNTGSCHFVYNLRKSA